MPSPRRRCSNGNVRKNNSCCNLTVIPCCRGGLASRAVNNPSSSSATLSAYTIICRRSPAIQYYRAAPRNSVHLHSASRESEDDPVAGPATNREHTHTRTHTKASVTASSQSHLLPHRQVFASRIFFHLALFLTYFTPKGFYALDEDVLPLKSPPSESCSCARRACNALAHFLPCVSEQSQRNSSV